MAAEVDPWPSLPAWPASSGLAASIDATEARSLQRHLQHLQRLAREQRGD